MLSETFSSSAVRKTSICPEERFRTVAGGCLGRFLAPGFSSPFNLGNQVRGGDRQELGGMRSYVDKTLRSYIAYRGNRLTERALLATYFDGELMAISFSLIEDVQSDLSESNREDHRGNLQQFVD